MEARERRFGITISGAHGVDHFLKRVFPPLVPLWAVAFGLPLWKIGLLLGARTLGSALGQAPVGHLSDRYDRRIVLPAGFLMMGCGLLTFPLLAAFEPGITVAVAGTTFSGQFVAMLVVLLLIGTGSSTLHPIGYPLISQNISPARKGRVLGWWGSARAFGDGAAPAIVGLGLLVLGWQWVLAGIGLAGVGYGVFLYIALADYETRPAGQVATEAGENPAKAWIWDYERRVFLYPLLAVFVAFVLQIVATSGTTIFLPQFIASEYGYSFDIAGLIITPESTASFYYSALLLTAGIAQFATGRLVDLYDHRKVLIGFLLAGATMLVVLSTMAFSAFVLLPVLLLLGATLWGLNPARDAIVSDIAPAESEGRTFGYIWTGALIMSSMSPAIVGRIGDIAGLRQAFLVVAGLVLLSTIPIALLLSDRVYKEAPPRESGAD
ncbi:MAG: MFS transporter [Salinirussus sp.]